MKQLFSKGKKNDYDQSGIFANLLNVLLARRQMGSSVCFCTWSSEISHVIQSLGTSPVHSWKSAKDK